MTKLLYLIAALIVIFIAARFAVSWASQTPATAGISGEFLGPCPSTPNCVNSAATEPDHSIAALQPAPGMTVQDIAATLETLPGVKLVTLEQNYLHATAQTRLWGFIDDVEILQIEGSDDLQIRSASRLGTSDLGANRKRVEALRELLSSSP